MLSLVVAWGVPKREIFRRFSTAELEELRIFRRVEPWGGEWDNLRFGTVATAAAGANPYRKAADVPNPGDWFKRRRTRRRRQMEADRAAVERAAKKFQKWRDNRS